MSLLIVALLSPLSVSYLWSPGRIFEDTGRFPQKGFLRQRRECSLFFFIIVKRWRGPTPSSNVFKRYVMWTEGKRMKIPYQIYRLWIRAPNESLSNFKADRARNPPKSYALSPKCTWNQNFVLVGLNSALNLCFLSLLPINLEISLIFRAFKSHLTQLFILQF